MSKKLFPGLLLAITLLAGCKLTTTKVQSPVSPSSKEIAVGNLGGVVANQSIASSPPTGNLGVAMVEIKNDWNGYSDITPIIRHYRLLPQGNGLGGNGNFAVGGYGGYGIQQQYTKKITIDSTLTQKFLQTLAETKITKSNRYNPHRDHSDDYPDISIYIKTADREVTFASRSQGTQNIPWQVRIKTKGKVESFVSNSPNPAQALVLLQAQIDHPGLEQAIAKQQKIKPKSTVKPTSTSKPAKVVINPSQSP
jgi:hypothetical protein